MLVGLRALHPDPDGTPLDATRRLRSLAYGDGRWLALDTAGNLFEFDPLNWAGAAQLGSLGSEAYSLLFRAANSTWYVTHLVTGQSRISELDPDAASLSNAASLVSGFAATAAQLAYDVENDRVYGAEAGSSPHDLFRLNPLNWADDSGVFGLTWAASRPPPASRWGLGSAMAVCSWSRNARVQRSRRGYGTSTRKTPTTRREATAPSANCPRTSIRTRSISGTASWLMGFEYGATSRLKARIGCGCWTPTTRSAMTAASGRHGRASRSPTPTWRTPP